MIIARRGSGAFFTGERIGVSSINTLNWASLCTGFPYDLRTNARNNIGNFIEFMHRGQAIKRDSSAALSLAYLACRRFDGFWELKLNPWDVAAGCLIIREVGGIITDFQGESFNMYEDDIVASNGLIHEEMLEVLREDRRR